MSKTKKLLWPETVPILNGNDMFLGDLHSPCGRRHCLVGHDLNVFGDLWVEVTDTIRLAIRESTGVDYHVPTFNDNHKCADNAKIWNRAMYLLGYTEGNPQSKPVKLKE